MYIFLLMNSMMLSIMFMMMNHPISLGFILLLQTINISLISSFFTYSFWLSYILFLIMIGGMLILFTYVTSISSNESFKNSNKILIFMTMTLTILMMALWLSEKTQFFQYFKLTEMMNFNLMTNMFPENTIMLNKIYNKPSNIITMILINYLFITLVIVVKITNIKSGPLRQKF